MKNNFTSKDINYLLNNQEVFKKQINNEVSEITKKYIVLLSEYYDFIIDNIKIKNNNYSNFIIIRGIDTITNVFQSLLLATKNIDATYYHCQKSFYYYVEFVGQISDEEKMFLQLSSRDATTYVYKKTIFEINNECRKSNELLTDETRNKIEIVNIYINVYRTFFYKIIYNSKSVQKIKSNIENFIKLADKINTINFNVERINTFEKVIDFLYYNVENAEKLIEICIPIIKKISKNRENILIYEKFILSDNSIDEIIKLIVSV